MVSVGLLGRFDKVWQSLIIITISLLTSISQEILTCCCYFVSHHSSYTLRTASVTRIQSLSFSCRFPGLIAATSAIQPY
jgi:hypothetical protein